MRQGSTPTLMIKIKKHDLSNAAAIVVTFRQGAKLYNFEADRLTVVASGDASTLALTLTQEETLAMRPGGLTLQVRWVNTDGEAFTTDVASVSNLEALYKEVIG